MIKLRPSLAAAQQWLPRLLSAVVFVGCSCDGAHPSAPPQAPGVMPPAVTKEAAGAAPSPAVTSTAAASTAAARPSAPAVITPTPPVPERPWDSCSSQDPNPWPWRSDAEGKWGENPLAVPAFALKQERRAPKMPDADRYLGSLGHTRVQAAPGLKDALLICQVETYSRSGKSPAIYQYKLLPNPPARHRCSGEWDPLGGPDVLLRFRFRDEYPIALFGPEDHWGFFISIPSVALAVGDKLTVKLWDRDSGTYWNGYINDQKNEYMGEAALKFDGNLPFTLRSEFFTLRCNAMPATQTRALAKSWLAQLDRPLQTGRDWHPDLNRWDFGANDNASSVDADFGRGIFRYPAGFLGWESPEIQTRLVAMGGQATEDERKRRAKVTELGQKPLPATKGEFHLDGTYGTLHFESAQCRSDGCEVQAKVGARLLKDLCTQVSTRPLMRAAGIDDRGKFAAAFTEIKQEDGWQPCSSSVTADKSGATSIRINIVGSSGLMWLGGVGKAAIFKLPASS